MIQTRIVKRMHCERIVFVPQRRAYFFWWNDYPLGSAFQHYPTLGDAISFIVSSHPGKNVRVVA